jgi:hypothetical protein
MRAYDPGAHANSTSIGIRKRTRALSFNSGETSKALLL